MKPRVELVVLADGSVGIHTDEVHGLTVQVRRLAGIVDAHAELACVTGCVAPLRRVRDAAVARVLPPEVRAAVLVHGASRDGIEPIALDASTGSIPRHELAGRTDLSASPGLARRALAVRVRSAHLARRTRLT